MWLEDIRNIFVCDVRNKIEISTTQFAHLNNTLYTYTLRNKNKKRESQCGNSTNSNHTHTLNAMDPNNFFFFLVVVSPI